MVTIKLRGLVSDTDRHGNTRYYVRLKGHPKIRMQGEPGSDGFMAGYHAAMSGSPLNQKPKLEHVNENSFVFLCSAYFRSTDFLVDLGPETQKVRRRILGNVCKAIGDMPFKRIEERHVRSWMDDRADRPEAANGLLKTFRGIFKFAVERKLLAVDPVAAIGKIKVATDGFHTWTIDEAKQFEAFHPVGTQARLTYAIASFLGLRRADVAIVGRQHIQGGKIVLRPAKNQRQKVRQLLRLPILPVLIDALEATPTGTLTFLESSQGKPYSVGGLGAQFRKWCDYAGLPHCTMHGLRKSGATIAAENGATDRQLMAIYGWSKADMATLYTREASQEKLADEGMSLLVRKNESEQTLSHREIQWVKSSKKAS